ncbi:Zinc finger protein 732 [Amphibalanus amphitrite]|uniref:Zinc finger protein 732 n=1 Tax=Amphibalanus amphitrite TaxID=1232801 RepID=A0A6A4VKG6_AMPAM|nr:Zinc finger protein 732 [Amphibalanus amphitrite]
MRLVARGGSGGGGPMAWPAAGGDTAHREVTGSGAVLYRCPLCQKAVTWTRRSHHKAVHRGQTTCADCGRVMACLQSHASHRQRCSARLLAADPARLPHTPPDPVPLRPLTLAANGRPTWLTSQIQTVTSGAPVMTPPRAAMPRGRSEVPPGPARATDRHHQEVTATGALLYRCPVCHKAVSWTARSHHKAVHSGRTVCPRCGRQLASLKSFNKHRENCRAAGDTLAWEQALPPAPAVSVYPAEWRGAAGLGEERH